jgi:hypothetical protein
MLNLPKRNQRDLDKYFSLVEKHISTALAASKLSGRARSYLTIDKIQKIVFSEPPLLMRFHNDIIPLLGNHLSVAGFNSYLDAKAKRKNKRTRIDWNLVHAYDSRIKELENVFNYDKVISGKKHVSYELAVMLDRNTCTYCNRLYTITVLQNAKANNGISRPQFDHWYSKKRYPILALSFYNLIPSCSICNSTIKGDTDFQLATHYHPYIDSFLNEFTFTYHHESVTINNVKIKYLTGSTKAKKTLEAFKIEEIYNGHSLLELKDLIELKKKYSDSYLETLFRDVFQRLSTTPAEAFRLLFGTEFDDDNFHKRPFSKFKRDIIAELKLLDSK